jgi:hypothetical protein
MAHIERRVRNGKTTYRARYRDPAGREHAKVFARKSDAQRFLTEMENSKLKGAWTNPALGRVLFREGSRSGSGPRPGCGRTPRPGTSGCSGCTSSPTSARYRSPALASGTYARGWPH